MKFNSFSMIALLVACGFFSTQAALGDTYKFNNGAGGSGTWQNASGGTPWSDGGTTNLQWDNSGNNIAQFDSAAGTVDVEGSVIASYLLFSTTGSEHLNGSGTITLSGTSGSLVLQNNNTNPVTIDNNLLLDDTINSDRFNVTDASSTGSTITLNGNINYTGSVVRGSGQGLIFNGKTNSNFILNGSFAGTAVNAGRLLLYGGGTLTLNGDYTGANPSNLLEIDAGKAVLGTSKTGSGQISMGGSPTITTALYTSGAQTITNTIGVQNLSTGTSVPGMSIIGGSTADVSTYSGNVGVVVSGLTVTAAAGGQVNFTGVINNNITTGLIKTGAGTVKLSGANTYGINAYNPALYPNGTVAADLQQGTTLIANTTGSAFGGSTGTVKIESGAILGGSGISTQRAAAQAADSVIAAGVGTTSATTLHLNGGLDATSGLTMNFTLYGTANDAVDFGGKTFNPGGIITINLTGTPTINVANNGIFRIMTGLDSFDSNLNGGTYDINAPTGYTVVDFGGGSVSDPKVNGYLYVQLALAPEPSTYALFLLGGAGLLFLARRRRVNA